RAGGGRRGVRGVAAEPSAAGAVTALLAGDTADRGGGVRAAARPGDAQRDDSRAGAGDAARRYRCPNPRGGADSTKGLTKSARAGRARLLPSRTPSARQEPRPPGPRLARRQAAESAKQVRSLRI